MTNILDALLILKNTKSPRLENGDKGNSIQIVGDSLEKFIQRVFSNTLDPSINSQTRLEKIEEVFSYIGVPNQPPDAILRGGDAIEVKKVDSLKGEVQLNSSNPHEKLFSNDSRINNTCREVAKKEGWTEKDIFYVIGSLANKKELIRLWFIYGDCYAASQDVYEKVTNKVKKSIQQDFSEEELSETNEIGSVPRVDPLGITRLRVRGMWIIKNPSVVFADYIEESDKQFKTYCILREQKYESFSQESRDLFEKNLDDSLMMQSIKIPDPNNPANTLNARLIKYEI